jgi:hypothetical protein
MSAIRVRITTALASNPNSPISASCQGLAGKCWRVQREKTLPESFIVGEAGESLCQGASGIRRGGQYKPQSAAAVFMRVKPPRVGKIGGKTHKSGQIQQFVIFEFYGLYLIYI